MVWASFYARGVGVFSSYGLGEFLCTRCRRIQLLWFGRVFMHAVSAYSALMVWASFYARGVGVFSSYGLSEFLCTPYRRADLGGEGEPLTKDSFSDIMIFFCLPRAVGLRCVFWFWCVDGYKIGVIT